ncbi:unnamed protein product [Paramecium primaurelia]|uniref:Uncharacterized protein n=2 Tax=Paramecium TaxID=5884 RepID=A0A8S1VPA5_9CILI|nr:unnamed protein product [Paramecium primaurelia]CAD8177452.1 unnamed protein product [Paramecium pentaurelia]
MGSILNKQEVSSRKLSEMPQEQKSQHYTQEVQENEQARIVIQTYRDTKISRKVHNLDPEVKLTFSKQFPKKQDLSNAQGQTSSIQQKETFQLSPRSPDKESDCDWQDIYGDHCFTLSDGHVAQH